jgi:hypothetical protein
MIRVRNAAVIAVAISGILSANAEIVAQWNFNSSPSDLDTTTGSLAASTGSGSASGVGVLTGFSSGCELDPAPVDNSGFSTTGYPEQGTGNKSSGVQFTASTEGLRNISLTWFQRSSETGSRYSRIQYSTNGIDFRDMGIVVGIQQADEFEYASIPLGSVPGVANNSNFAFRIVAEFQSTATGSGLAGYVTASPEAYTTLGTERFDMVTISGDRFTTPDLSPIGYPTNGVFQFMVLGDQGSTCVFEYSDSLGPQNWIPISTNSVPFQVSDTLPPNTTRRLYRARIIL